MSEGSTRNVEALLSFKRFGCAGVQNVETVLNFHTCEKLGEPVAWHGFKLLRVGFHDLQNLETLVQFGEISQDYRTNLCTVSPIFTWFRSRLLQRLILACILMILGPVAA